MPRRRELGLILDDLVLPARAQVLVMYARATAPLLALRDLSAGGRVVALAPELPDYTRLQQEIGAKAGAEITIALENLSALPEGGPFDGALLDTDGPAGRGNSYTRRLIDTMVRSVRPGGGIWLQGSNQRGLQTFVRHLALLCGEVAPLGVGGGKRAYRAMRPAGEVATASDATEESSVEVAIQGVRFQLILQPGVFGARKVDEATELLIKALHLRRRDHVLDLGCGAGAIGIAASLLAPAGQTLLVDSTPLAVQLAGRNIAANGIANAAVLLSDGYSALAGRRFDVIATNPPFHQHSAERRDVAERFIREAPDHLHPGGRCYVVANAFLPYERLMAGIFDEVQVLTTTPSYKVLVGLHQPAASSEP